MLQDKERGLCNFNNYPRRGRSTRISKIHAEIIFCMLISKNRDIHFFSQSFRHR